MDFPSGDGVVRGAGGSSWDLHCLFHRRSAAAEAKGYWVYIFNPYDLYGGTESKSAGSSWDFALPFSPPGPAAQQTAFATPHGLLKKKNHT